jgi:hypothetical protein
MRMDREGEMFEGPAAGLDECDDLLLQAGQAPDLARILLFHGIMAILSQGDSRVSG